MEKVSKQVIDEILHTNLSQEVPILGEVLGGILFKRKKMAMAIRVDGRECAILLPLRDSQHSIQKALLELTDVVSTLVYLEKERLIVIADEWDTFSGVFYEDSERFGGDQLPHVYQLSDDLKITTRDDEPTRLIEKTVIILESCSVETKVVDMLMYFLCSRALPTQALKDFAARGYKTKEEQLTRRGLKYSVASMIIAVVIAIATQIGTVLIGNRHGVSTINHEQFDSLLQATKNIRIVSDTIILEPIAEKNNGQK